MDQRLVTLGGAADDVRAVVDPDGLQVVANAAHGTGCSSSIAAAVPVPEPTTDVVVLLLGRPAVRDAGDGASTAGRPWLRKLLEQNASRIVGVRIAGSIPLDVDTREDDERLLSSTT